MLLKRISGFISRKVFFLFLMCITGPRRIWFSMLSFGVKKQGRPILHQPGLLVGKGKLIFGKNVRIGYSQSPSFFSSYSYLEARGKNSKIEFHNNIWCNNNFCVIADNTSVTISDNCFIGANVEILDSNFHDLRTNQNRHEADPDPQPVFIGKNVFIGNGVKILKGVTIGSNSVIGVNSLVTHDIPANSKACGSPAKVVGNIITEKNTN